MILSNRLSVLYVIDSLVFGGAQRQLVELIKGLDKEKVNIHICFISNYLGGYTEIITKLGIKINYYDRKFKFDIRPIFKISRYIKENKIDVVHSFMNLGSLVGVAAAKLAQRPVVCSSIRDAKDKNFKCKISKKILARLADIFVSNSWAGFTNRFNTMRPHFRLVYNGVDFSRFQENKIDVSKFKNDLRVADFKHIVGMVASLSENKDHETLLNASAAVLQDFPDTCFLLVGDGSERKKLAEKVSRMGLKKNVLFLGYRKDVDRIYQILKICILLTNSDVILEGTSNAIIEAMALGVPVIASEGGGTSEIIENDANGVLVPPKNPQKTAEAIVRLLGNKVKAERLGQAGKMFVREKFDLQRYAEEYESIYRELYRGHKRPIFHYSIIP